MTTINTEPYFAVFVMDDEHPDGVCGFQCNICRRDVSDQPCPEHAPKEVPGLALVDCEATPRHWVWTLAGDYNGYGNPCPWCMLNDIAEEQRQARWCKHWGWRRWKVTHWLAGKSYWLGLTSGGGGWIHGEGHNGCLSSVPRINLQPRVYVLGVKRETWRCWLVGHHRRGEEVGLGFCGKCVPWPCCGSQRVEHVEGCPEDV